MFKTVEPLSHSKHKDLRLSKVTSLAFAKNISALKLSFSELRQASQYYPIVFLKGAPCVPHALLSLKPGQNAFIDENGKWKVPYIPAYLRLYPFTLAKIQDESDKFAFCIDPNADHFKSGMGEPLFTADGESTELVQNIFKSLELYQNEVEATKVLFKALDDQGVIVDRAFKYRVNQEEKTIDGFKGVDMKKLIALDDKSIADYVKNGTMGMVYEHNHSLSNFSKFIAQPAR